MRGESKSVSFVHVPNSESAASKRQHGTWGKGVDANRSYTHTHTHTRTHTRTHKRGQNHLLHHTQESANVLSCVLASEVISRSVRCFVPHSGSKFDKPAPSSERRGDPAAAREHLAVDLDTFLPGHTPGRWTRVVGGWGGGGGDKGCVCGCGCA